MKLVRVSRGLDIAFHSFIHLFFHSFVRSFVLSFIYSFIHFRKHWAPTNSFVLHMARHKFYLLTYFDRPSKIAFFTTFGI